ncbi:MAG: hypothetical protein ACE37K_24625 [Planctomycetota bacterium]
MNPTHPILAAIGLSLSTALVSAQCGLVATPAFAHRGPSARPDVVRYWDSDGAGPAPMLVFVGGAFAYVEATPCAGAALYDPATRSWTTLPAGPFDHVRAAAVDGNNTLLVAGSLGQGAAAVHRVARWNGSVWTVLGGDFDAEPLVVGTLANGDPVAGGRFTACAGQPTARLARWNGSQWVGLGGGVAGGPDPLVQSICIDANGDLLAGGAFATAGSTPAQNLARWSSSGWSALGAGVAQPVASIAVMSGGDVFAAAPTLPAVRRWDGSTWSDLPGLGPSNSFPAGPWIGALGITTGFQGEALMAVGDFDAFGQQAGVALWEPLAGWTALYAPLATAATFTPSRLSLSIDPRPGQNTPTAFALAGPFEAVSGEPCNGVAVVGSWQADPMGGGIDAPVQASTALPNGDLLLGGSFYRVERNYSPGLVRGVGGTWLPQSTANGPVLQGAPFLPEVRAIEPAADGSVLIAGSFVVGPNGDVMRFDGATWSGFGNTPFLGGASCVVELEDGTVYAGGNGLFRHGPTGWTLLSTQQSGLSGQFATLAELPGGDLVAGGALQSIPGGGQPGVMRWNGQAWLPLGAGLTSAVAGTGHVVSDCVVRRDGVLFVCGTTTAQPFVASFDGSSWQSLPAPTAGVLHTIAVLPDGDLVVGGEFDAIGGVAARSLARFDGTGWSQLAGGVGAADGTPGTVLDLQFTRRGELHVAGRFVEHDGLVAVHFTRVRTDCPATGQSFGPNCVGSGGPNVLRAEQGAFLGGELRSVAEGLPTGGLALDVLGLSPTVQPLPLSACTLWVTPDFVQVAGHSQGRAQLSLPIPASAALLGSALYQQVVGVELTAGALTGLSAGNRLQHTIGMF